MLHASASLFHGHTLVDFDLFAEDLAIVNLSALGSLDAAALVLILGQNTQVSPKFPYGTVTRTLTSRYPQTMNLGSLGAQTLLKAQQ